MVKLGESHVPVWFKKRPERMILYFLKTLLSDVSVVLSA